MNSKQIMLLKTKSWQWLLISVVISEVLTSLSGLILTGKVSIDYLATGFVVSLIVTSLIVYILNQAREIEGQGRTLLEEAYQSLEEKVEQRTSELVLANEELRVEGRERERAQEESRISDKRYRDLFDGTSDLIMVHDLNGQFLDVNPAVLKLLGYARDEMIDRSVAEFVAPLFHSRFREEYLRRIIERGHLEGVTVFRAKDGADFYVEYRNIVISRAGMDSYVSGAGRDITAQLKANRVLGVAKHAAETANLAKSDFLANMSHEFRTPLNHIIGFTDLVVNKSAGDLTEKQQEYLDDVLSSSRHLLSLINDILELSKVEAGKLDLDASDVNLKPLIESGILMVEETAVRNEIRITTDIEEIPETIVADERKLKQIVFNLLSNAVKFTPQQGTVHIEGFRLPLATAHSLGHARRSISAQEAEYLSTVETGDSIVISVQDSGIGMRQEDLKRIFNAFDQVENSKSRQYSGTGLGLSLTKQLVELHNGRIWAESEGVGKGSRFRVIIPCRL